MSKSKYEQKKGVRIGKDTDAFSGRRSVGGRTFGGSIGGSIG